MPSTPFDGSKIVATSIETLSSDMMVSTIKALSNSVRIFLTSIEIAFGWPPSPLNDDRAQATGGATSPPIETGAIGGAPGRKTSVGAGTAME